MDIEEAAAEEAERQRQAEEAELARTVAKKDTARLTTEGDELYKLENFEGAIVKYNQAIALNDRFAADLTPHELNVTVAAAFNSRGNAYLALRKPAQAIEDYDQAIKLDPTFAKAFYNRGNVYLALRNHVQAIEDYNQAIALNPKYATAYNNRGNVYFALHMLDQAINDYDRAIELQSEYPRALFNRGLAFLQLNLVDQAIKDFTRAIAINRDYSDAFFNRGLAFLKHHRIDKAIADFTKVVSLPPLSGRGYLGLGKTHSRARDRQQAKDNLSRARDLLSQEITNFPDDALLRLWRGQAFRELALLEPAPSFFNRGRKTYLEKARSDLNEALRLDPSLVEAIVERGCVHLALGLTEQARDDFVAARSSVPRQISAILQELRAMQLHVLPTEELCSEIAILLVEFESTLAATFEQLSSDITAAQVQAKASEVRAAAAEERAAAAEERAAAAEENRASKRAAAAEEQAAAAEKRAAAAEEQAAAAEERAGAAKQEIAKMEQRWMIPLDRLAIDERVSLGSGALGEVKRAIWNNSIPVAAKRLFFMATDPAALRAMGGALDTAQRESVLRDFLKECSINSSIRHPNIVMFLGVGVDRSSNNEPRFLVLELMEQGSQNDEIYPGGSTPRQGSPMALDRVASILLDITRALVYLHSREPPVIHLDLKPKNVLIDRAGTAKIGDLGEAHVIQSTRQAATKTCFGIGTPVYMAPEMGIEGVERGPAADMFSLGVMACEMSSGQSPNPGANIVRIDGHTRVIPEQQRREADIKAMLHREIRELVDRLTLDEPGHRWSAMQVQSSLEALLQQAKRCL